MGQRARIRRLEARVAVLERLLALDAGAELERIIEQHRGAWGTLAGTDASQCKHEPGTADATPVWCVEGQDAYFEGDASV